MSTRLLLRLLGGACLLLAWCHGLGSALLARGKEPALAAFCAYVAVALVIASIGLFIVSGDFSDKPWSDD